MTDSGEERNKNFITVICLLLIKGGFFFFLPFHAIIRIRISF